MSEYSAYVGLDVHKDSIAVSIARPPALQRSRPISAIWMAYMADHAGWSSLFRFGHAWLVVWGPPFRRRGSARAVPRAVRADGLAGRVRAPAPVGGGEGAAGSGGARGAGASAATRRSRPDRRSRGSGRRRARHRGGPRAGRSRPRPSGSGGRRPAAAESAALASSPTPGWR